MFATIASFFASAGSTLRGALESLVKVQHPSTSAETVPVLESLVSPASTGAERPVQSFTSAASAFAVSTLSIFIGICLLPFVIVWLYASQAVHSFSAPSKSFIAARPEVQPRPDARRPLPAPQSATAISRPVPRSMRLRWASGKIPLEEMPLFRQWQEELEQRMNTAVLAEPSPEPRVGTMPKRVVGIRTKRSLAPTANGSSSAPVKEQPVKRRSALEATAEDLRQELQNQLRRGCVVYMTTIPEATEGEVNALNGLMEQSMDLVEFGRVPGATSKDTHDSKPLPPLPKASGWATRNDIVEAMNRAEKSGREIGRTVRAATYEEVHGKPMPIPKTYGWATAKDIVEAKNQAEKSGRYIGRTIRAATYEEVHGKPMPTTTPKTYGWATAKDIAEANDRAEKSGREIGRTIRAATYEEVHGLQPVCSDNSTGSVPPGLPIGPGLFSGPDPDGFTIGSGLCIGSVPSGFGSVSGPHPGTASFSDSTDSVRSGFGSVYGSHPGTASFGDSSTGYGSVSGKPLAPASLPRTPTRIHASHGHDALLPTCTRQHMASRFHRSLSQTPCHARASPGAADLAPQSLDALNDSDCTPWADELETVYDCTNSSLLSELDNAQDIVDGMLYDIEKRNAEAELPIDRWNAIYTKRKRREERAARNAASRMARNFNLSAASTEPDSSCTVTPERSVFWWHRDL